MLKKLFFILSLFCCSVAYAHILHVGDKTFQLDTVKRTSPALGVGIDDGTFYGVLYSGTAPGQTLHVRRGDEVYWLGQNCAAGKYSETGISACTDCTIGHYCTGGIYDTDCPSGYPNSDSGASVITSCYSNSKSRAWTGAQTACSAPANSYSHTCNSCSGSACSYVAYSNSAGNGDGTIKSGCSSNAAACTQSVASFTCKAGYYKNGSTCTACPSGYPNSDNGNSTGITACYSNTKSRAWTGGQNACTKPSNCATVTCNTCSGSACDYVAYSNSAGTGDGTIKSGCSTNATNCNQTVKSVTANANYYVNGASCAACNGVASGAYPLSDGGAIGSGYCYASKTNTGSQVNGSVPTNCASVTEWNACTPGTCTWKDYYTATDTTCTPTNCTKTVKSVTAKSGYYVSGTSCSACSGLASGFYPNSDNGNTGGAGACKTNNLVGQYIATANASSATNCAAGTAKASHQVAYGSTSSCTTCAAGTYNTTTGNSSCTTCPAGHYCTGGQNKTACANWTYRSGTGGKAATDCTACPGYSSDWIKADSTGTGWISYTSCAVLSKDVPTGCSQGQKKWTSGDGTWTNHTETITVAYKANANYYVNGTACSACSGIASGAYPLSDGGAIGSGYCYASKTNTGSQVNGSVPTNCASVTEWNACTPGTCTWKDYYSATDTTCTPSNCTKTVKSVAAKSGYRVDGTSCTACPSGYPNSDNANTGGVIACYSNSKSRAWTGGQTDCTTSDVSNSYSVTCNSCSGSACSYVAYSNSAGNGDGTIKSGCSTNNSSCKKSVASFTCKAGYYKNGSTCSACSSGYSTSNGNTATSCTCNTLCTSVKNTTSTTSGSESCSIANGAGSRSYTNTCSGYYTNSACSSAGAACSGCSTYGTRSSTGTCYVTSCNTGYSKNATSNATACNCTTPCTSVNNTSSTQSCTPGCSVANGTCSYTTNSGSQTCNGKYTNSACSSAGGACSGCSSWGTCTGGSGLSVSCNSGYYKNGNACTACTSVAFTENGTDTENVTGGTRSRSKSRTCYRTGGAGGTSGSGSCTGSANCGSWGNYGSWVYSCNSGYTATSSSCTCNTVCTSVNNTSSTQSCTPACSVANGTCSYTTNSGSQTCNGKYTNSACSSAGGACSGCSSWGTCTGGSGLSVSCNSGYYKNGNACTACTSVSWTDSGTDTGTETDTSGCTATSQTVTVSITNGSYKQNQTRSGSRTRSWTQSKSRTCYRTGGAGGTNGSSACTGSNCGAYSYGTKNYDAYGSCSYSAWSNSGGAYGYSCNAGYYLSGTSCIACGAGYYCTGGTASRVACTYGVLACPNTTHSSDAPMPTGTPTNKFLTLSEVNSFIPVTNFSDWNQISCCDTWGNATYTDTNTINNLANACAHGTLQAGVYLFMARYYDSRWVSRRDVITGESNQITNAFIAVFDHPVGYASVHGDYVFQHFVDTKNSTLTSWTISTTPIANWEKM